MELFTLLAKTKFTTYMPYIIAVVAILAIICVVNWYKAKKADEHYLEVTGLLNVGAKIKTLTGIYGTVKSVEVKENVRYVVIELFDGALMEIDARAIYGLDERTMPKEEAPMAVSAETPVQEAQEEKKEEEESKEEEPSPAPKKTRAKKSN